jgi:L-lactate permease
VSNKHFFVMVMHITHPFRTTFSSLLVGKLYAFRQRSVWRYLLGALLLSLAQPQLLHNFWLTLVALAGAFVGLGLAMVALSSYVQRRQQLFEADVTFWPTHIEVQPTSGALAETHDWQWVLQASEDKRRFFLVVRSFPRLVLLLDKSRLTAEEVAAFRTWLAASRSSQANTHTR